MLSVDELTPKSHDWLRRGSSIHELGDKDSRAVLVKTAGGTEDANRHQLDGYAQESP